MKNSELIKKFDKQAKMYEKKRKKKTQAEWRRKLLSYASGKVLEVAVGAGANFPFYPKDLDITAVDFSTEMLRKSKDAATEYDLNVKFLQSDVETLEVPDNSYDTIISTLSLCGYEHPFEMLNRFNKWCKDDGKILLMEHGISSNFALSTLQKGLNPLAYKIAGCQQTRDIVDIVQHSNLEIEQMEHYWLNTVHLIWAHPKKI